MDHVIMLITFDFIIHGWVGCMGEGELHVIMTLGTRLGKISVKSVEAFQALDG